MSWLTAKLAGIGALVLGALAFWVRLQSVTNARDRARQEADVLKARHHVVKTNAKIKRQEDKVLFSRKAEIAKDLEREGEDFKGSPALSNPNED